MAKDPDNLAGSFETENTGGLLSGFLAEEDEFDRRALWRLGSWGVGAIAAVIVAVMANQSQLSLRREQIAAADLTRQAQQVQLVARESLSEARRLASAIDTLSGDRDRLYSRVTTLEQGLDSVTGAIVRQGNSQASGPAASAAKPSTPTETAAQTPPTPAPAVAPVATTQAPTAAEKPVAVDKPPAMVVTEASPPATSTVSKDNAKVAGAKSASAKSDGAKPDSAKADNAKPDIVAPELPKIESVKTDVAKTDTAKTDTAKTATAKADSPSADSGKADAKPDGAKVDAAKAEAAKPETAKPETAKAEIAKPDVAKPDVAKPDVAKPDSSKADNAKNQVASSSVPLVASKSIMAPPDPAATKLIEPTNTTNTPGPAVTAAPIPEVVASAPAAATDEEADEATLPKVAIQRTEFGVDLGSANSVNGLRALWRGLLKSRANAPLASLRPIIVVKEVTNGLGMQLRLVAGPLNDAGAAARICATLTENKRACETTVFDGQRLSLKADDTPPAAATPAPRRRGNAKRAAAAPVVVEEPKKPEPTTLSSWFGRKGQ